MKRIRMLFFGLLFGVGTGVVLALLFAPDSGEKMRQEARAQYDQLLAEARKAADARRQELEQQLTEMTSATEAES